MVRTNHDFHPGWRGVWYRLTHRRFDIPLVALEPGTILDEDAMLHSPGGWSWPAPRWAWEDEDETVWISQEPRNEWAKGADQ